MRTRIKKTHYLVVLCAVVLAAACFIGIPAIRGQKRPPKVISKVKNIEVVSVALNGAGAGESVAVQIRNNSDKPITAVAVESRNEKEASGIILNRFSAGEEQSPVVLQPYETTVIDLPLSSVRPGAGIRIGGVMYADGTEEGEEKTLETMREHKAHDKAESLKRR